MKEILRSFCGALLTLAFVVLVVAGALSGQSAQKARIKDHSWLVLDLYGPLPEFDAPAGLAGQVLGGGGATLQQMLDNLAKAAVDERIDGVVFKMSATNGASWGKLDELRAGVQKVRDAGKPVYAWSDAMSAPCFYLAAACDSLFMPPTGYVSFHGFAATSEHLKPLLDKLGVREQLHKIKDYKAAAEMFQRADASPEARENRAWMLDERWDAFTAALDRGRRLDEARVVALMEKAVLLPREAQADGLVDRVLYWDELEARLKQPKDERLRAVGQERYAEVKPEKVGLKGKKTIAVVHIHGMIGGRESSVNPLLGPMIGHETVVAQLRKARQDKKVAAIVFRVDSPGGEALASDLIGHEVEITAKVKPVVASMVGVAASGGYHVAYRASKIVADPLTTTGSIGSISGRMNFKGLMDKLGVNQDAVTKGPNADWDFSDRDYTPEQWARFTDRHWAEFNDWLRDVAEHRGLAFAAAEKLAHGRVWTGRQAKENRLVDEVGGLDRAVAVAKDLAGIAVDDKVTLRHYPEKQGLLAALTGGGKSGGSGDGALGAQLDAAAGWAAYRFLQVEARETWRLLTSPLAIAPDVD